MIISVIIVFPAVGVALAFTKSVPNLYTCENNVCVLSIYSSFVGTKPIQNPGNLWIADPNGTCGDTERKCKQFNTPFAFENL